MNEFFANRKEAEDFLDYAVQAGYLEQTIKDGKTYLRHTGKIVPDTINDDFEKWVMENER